MLVDVVSDLKIFGKLSVFDDDNYDFLSPVGWYWQINETNRAPEGPFDTEAEAKEDALQDFELEEYSRTHSDLLRYEFRDCSFIFEGLSIGFYVRNIEGCRHAIFIGDGKVVAYDLENIGDIPVSKELVEQKGKVISVYEFENAGVYGLKSFAVRRAITDVVVQLNLFDDVGVSEFLAARTTVNAPVSFK